MPVLPPTRRRGGGRSSEGRKPGEPDWPLLISLKEMAWLGPVTQPNGVMRARSGKVEVISSFQATPTPASPSHPGYRHRDLLPRKEGLSFGPPFRGGHPRPIATASRDARSLQLPASAGAPGTPTAVPAPCLECCQPKGWGRPGYLQAQGSRYTATPSPLFLDLAARPEGRGAQRGLGQFLGTDRIPAEPTDTQSLQQTLSSWGQAPRHAEVGTWFVEDTLIVPHPTAPPEGSRRQPAARSRRAP